jgi:hypothetical protein
MIIIVLLSLLAMIVGINLLMIAIDQERRHDR